MDMRTILLINGPNLDMLGVREPEVYGAQTLADIETMVATYAGDRGIAVSRFQSNSEGDLINVIHHAPEQFDGIVYNPGAHTHYSYALRDAIAGCSIPVVEVHISDVDQREAFRRTSVTAPACVAQVKGLGVEGYCRGVDILCSLEELQRLGEGYEAFYSSDDAIKVAGKPTRVPETEEPAAHEPDLAEDALADQEEPQEQQDVPESPDAEDEALFAPVPVPAEELEDPQPTEQEADDELDPDELSEEEPPAGEQVEAPEEVLEDFAAPYEQDIAAVDGAALAAARQQLLRDAMAQMQVDAFLVRDTPNIKWLTAVDGVFDEERAHALLITSDKALLHTDSRYANAVQAQLNAMGAAVQVYQERVGHMQFVRDALAAEDGSFASKVAIEDSITYAEYVKAVQVLGIESLAATTDIVLSLRGIKTNAELSRLLAAQAVTDAAFVHIVQFMRPGMTEREVQLELEDFMLRHGAEGLAFSSIVATGANGADPHAIPGKTKLQAGQCVVMDFGARAFGYCSDMTRMVFLGEPDQRLAQAYEVLRRANETVERAIVPGMTGKQAHELAEQVLAEGGFAGAMGHGLGHGVGLEVHEQPVLNTRNERPLVVGNVVTVEPGIYVPGEFGMRLEDCGVVTPNGYEAFSQLGHEMVII